jgi:hypothetical protein
MRPECTRSWVDAARNAHPEEDVAEHPAGFTFGEMDSQGHVRSVPGSDEGLLVDRGDRHRRKVWDEIRPVALVAITRRPSRGSTTMVWLRRV